MPRESGRELRGKKLLGERGYLVLKLGNQGVPDWLVCLSCHCHVFMEWKVPGGRLTPAQKRRIPALRRSNELVAIVTTPEEALEVALNADNCLSTSAASYELHRLFFDKRGRF